MFYLGILSIQRKIRRDRSTESRRSTGRSRSMCWPPLLYLINGVQCNSFKRLETDSSNKGQAVTAVMFCKERTFLKKRPEKNFNKFLLFIRLFITNSSSVSHGLIVLHRNMKHTQNGARAVRGFRMRQMRHLPQTPIFEMPWGPPC